MYIIYIICNILLHMYMVCIFVYLWYVYMYVYICIFMVWLKYAKYA